PRKGERGNGTWSVWQWTARVGGVRFGRVYAPVRYRGRTRVRYKRIEGVNEPWLNNPPSSSSRMNHAYAIICSSCCKVRDTRSRRRRMERKAFRRWQKSLTTW